MPGFYYMFPVEVSGKLHSAWRCDKCGKIFAFENNETLHCPKCKGRAYPMNMDVEETQSRIVTP